MKLCSLKLTFLLSHLIKADTACLTEVEHQGVICRHFFQSRISNGCGILGIISIALMARCPGWSQPWLRKPQQNNQRY